ncbi:MAG: SAM-dependent chlorinase/fluorinase [Chitinispirillaceae bacterium]|jgi:S-adenosylmethionine hydrolase
MGTIALITDYGTSDWFAGEMKGALLRIAPAAAIVDITHDIAAGDVRDAAFSLLSCYRSFPANTIFCIVVDPGVGTGRAGIAAESGSFFFVGPDNGVLSWALKKEENFSARRIENRELLPRIISNTFHGRDIFGPIAAYLSEKPSGFEAIGPVMPGIVTLPWPVIERDKEHLSGSIIHIDRFGNAVTTVDGSSLKLLAPAPQKVRIVKYGTELPLCDYFQQVPSGQGLAYLGSGGYLEIAINNANAAAVFGLHTGDKIEVL